VSLANQSTGRIAIERRLVGRAMVDAEFRERLVADPRSAVEEELGIDLPDGMQVEVVEEDPRRLCVVLPMDLSGIEAGAVWAMTGRRPGAARPARPAGSTSNP
jgi:hypothetical protein